MAYSVDPAIKAVIDKLLADAGVQKALAFIDGDQGKKIDELKEMVLLHGASFKEGELRSPMFKKKLEQYGATDCFIDSHDNAFGYLKGGSGPKIVYEAHLDTVFADTTPLAVTEKNGRIYCPGIGDDTAGLASVLCVLRAMKHAGLKPVGTLMFGGTSGEEGEGDIRGIKGLLDDNKDIAAVVSSEPGPVEKLVYGAIGSRRYEIIFKGPGGHSWSAYGLPSPIHAMGRAIAKMANVDTVSDPRTTYTVGIVEGGTSINSIALEARLKLDMRSVSTDELMKLEKKLLALVEEGVAEENAFRAKSGEKITVEYVLIGDRPAGMQPDNAPIVQATWAAIGVSGGDGTPRVCAPSSTNANAALNRGVPAVVLRTGGATGGTHTLDEWFQPEGSHVGDKAVLLLMLALAGLEGVTEPLKLK